MDKIITHRTCRINMQKSITKLSVMEDLCLRARLAGVPSDAYMLVDNGWNGVTFDWND